MGLHFLLFFHIQWKAKRYTIQLVHVTLAGKMSTFCFFNLIDIINLILFILTGIKAHMYQVYWKRLEPLSSAEWMMLDTMKCTVLGLCDCIAGIMTLCQFHTSKRHFHHHAGTRSYCSPKNMRLFLFHYIRQEIYQKRKCIDHLVCLETPCQVYPICKTFQILL